MVCLNKRFPSLSLTTTALSCSGFWTSVNPKASAKTWPSARSNLRSLLPSATLSGSAVLIKTTPPLVSLALIALPCSSGSPCSMSCTLAASVSVTKTIFLALVGLNMSCTWALIALAPSLTGDPTTSPE